MIIDPNKDYKVYHGSKGGIVGEINPNYSKKKREYNPADFGLAFYVGTNPSQAKGLVVEESDPVFYTFNLPLSQIDNDRILILTEEQWLYTVITYRAKSQQFNETELSKQIKAIVDSYDIVIGKIADDRMNMAIRWFNGGKLTSKGLTECLKYIDYGIQFAIKSKSLCKLIQDNELEHHSLKGKEAQDTIRLMESNRRSVYKVVEQMANRYRKHGLVIGEIIEQAEKNEISIEQIFGENALKRINNKNGTGNDGGNGGNPEGGDTGGEVGQSQGDDAPGSDDWEER